MSYFDILFIGIGLSMDAFAVSATDGLVAKPNKVDTLCIALAFGFFQGVMPLIGYYAGSLFHDTVAKYSHWLALILLGAIGGKMLYDGCKKQEDRPVDDKKLTFGVILIQAVATSIDALTVGISFVGIRLNIFHAVGLIAVTTFFISYAGVLIGKKSGDLFKNKAEIIGGCILIGIGLKIFFEAMFFS